MSSSPVPLIEIPNALVELNNGIPYSETNKGPNLNYEEIKEWVTVIPESDPDLTIKRKKPWVYRLQCTNYFMFYPNLIADKLQLSKVFEGIGALDTKMPLIISHNHGHTLVYAKYPGWGEKSGENAKTMFDFNGIHPLIHKVTQHRYGILYNWVKKADPMYVPEVKESTSVYDMFKGCETKVDALKQCSKIGDVSGALQAFECINEDRKKILDPYIMVYQPWGWQLHIYEKFKVSPEDRTIWWYWNNTPKLGKSMFGYYLMMKMPTYFLTICDPSTKVNVMHRVSQAINRGWNGHCLILNLTMSFEGKEYLYSILEGIKDSICTSYKYNGADIGKGPSHLVVFSNFKPHPYRDDGHESIDRRRIKVLEIPIPENCTDPNPPRPSLRVIGVIDLPIRPEDQVVMDQCEKSIICGSTIKFIQRDTKGKPVATNATTDAMDLDKVVMPKATPISQMVGMDKINAECATNVPPLPDVAKIIAKIEGKQPYDPDKAKWKSFLNKEEGSLTESGYVVQAWQVLLNKNSDVGERDLVVCREGEHKNYRLFSKIIEPAKNGSPAIETTVPVMWFFRNYFTKLPISERCLFEVITLNRPQKVYFDVDIPSNMKRDDEENLIKQIQAGIMIVEPNIKPCDIMTFSSHGPTKRSYHIVVDRFKVANHYENSNFFEEVKTHIDPKLYTALDGSVYKKVQQLRMYGCQKYEPKTKTGCGRIKILSPSQNTWVSKEKEEKMKEFAILSASLITYDNGLEEIKRPNARESKYVSDTRDYSKEEMKRICEIVEEKFPGIFKYYNERENCLVFKRLKPSTCPIHNRLHDKSDISVYVENASNKVYCVCFRIIKSDSVKKYELGIL